MKKLLMLLTFITLTSACSEQEFLTQNEENTVVEKINPNTDYTALFFFSNSNTERAQALYPDIDFGDLKFPAKAKDPTLFEGEKFKNFDLELRAFNDNDMDFLSSSSQPFFGDKKSYYFYYKYSFYAMLHLFSQERDIRIDLVNPEDRISIKNHAFGIMDNKRSFTVYQLNYFEKVLSYLNSINNDSKTLKIIDNNLKIWKSDMKDYYFYLYKNIKENKQIDSQVISRLVKELIIRDSDSTNQLPFSIDFIDRKVVDNYIINMSS